MPGYKEAQDWLRLNCKLMEVIGEEGHYERLSNQKREHSVGR